MEKPGQEDFKPLPLAIAEDKYEVGQGLDGGRRRREQRVRRPTG